MRYSSIPTKTRKHGQRPAKRHASPRIFNPQQKFSSLLSSWLAALTRRNVIRARHNDQQLPPFSSIYFGCFNWRKVLVIYPNATVQMTYDLMAYHAPPGIIARVISVDNGSGNDDALARIRATNATIAILKKENMLAEYDGFLVVSFSDHPLIKTLKNMTRKPVTDVFHASINSARAHLHGGLFGIVTGTANKGSCLTASVLEFIGGNSGFGGVINTGYSPVQVCSAEYKQGAMRAMAEAARELVWDKYLPCEVILFGCIGCVEIKKKLIEAVGSEVVVVDAFAAGLNELAGLIDSGESLVGPCLL